MHKLRRAMVRSDRDRLNGVVEVDETSIGGRERGKRTAGRGTTNKAVVAIAVEVLEPKGFGRVRLAHLRQVDSATLCGFVGSVVTPGATVRTDGWSVYAAVFRAPLSASRAINPGAQVEDQNMKSVVRGKDVPDLCGAAATRCRRRIAQRSGWESPRHG